MGLNFVSTVRYQAGHVVHCALGDRHVKRIHVTDNEIVMHWINSWEKPLKQFVRGSVVDVLRFTNKNDWFWVPSELNPCDVGTRREVNIQDVGPNSEWQLGKEWMRDEFENMPIFIRSNNTKLVYDHISHYTSQFPKVSCMLSSSYHAQFPVPLLLSCSLSS